MWAESSNKAPAYLANTVPTVSLIVLGLIAYINSFWCPFIFDSRAAILENPHVKSLWPPVQALAAPKQSPLAGRPVAALSFALNYSLNRYNTCGYHLVNLAVHLLAAVVLYRILKITLSNARLQKKITNSATPLAWIITAIWLVHPLQTESVTYIVQRTESLMGLFYLLVLYTAIKAMSSQRPLVWKMLSIICCGLGMATKEVMITAPLMILLYDRCFYTGSFRSSLKQRKNLYLSLAATWIILAVLVLPGPRSSSAGFGMKNLNAFDYAKSQFGVIVFYLRLTLWPKNLCLDHGWRIADSWQKIIPPMLLVLALLAVTFIGLFKNKTWSYPALWFFLVLAPSSSFVPIADLAFEHRLYLPLAGVITLLVTGTFLLFENIKNALTKNKSLSNSHPFVFLLRYVPITLAAVVIAALACATIARNKDYRSEISIWQDVVEKVPNNFRGRCNLAYVLTKKKSFDQAIKHYKKAIQLKPDDPEPCYNLANAFKAQGKISKAVDFYNKALELKPEYPEALTNLANIMFQQNRLDEAVGLYHRSLEIKPDDTDVRYNLAVAFQKQQKLPEAVEQYQQLTVLLPNDSNVYNNLGFALKLQGKLRQAVECFKKAVRLDPALPDAHNNLALTLQNQGKIEQAIESYKTALSLNPDFLHAHCNIALAYAAQKKFDHAHTHLIKALTLVPDDPNNPATARILKRISYCKQKIADNQPKTPNPE